MKIAFYAPENEFTAKLFVHLQTSLTADTLIRWIVGSPPPAPSIDLLIADALLDRATLSLLPRLALAIVISDGYDRLDIDAAADLGIWAANTPASNSGNADSVAEFAILLLIAASRHLNLSLRNLHDSSQPRPLLNQALVGKHVCIVGLGVIGRKIAHRLQPFGVHLSAVDRSAETKSAPFPIHPLSRLTDALASADYVVLAVRATAENRNLIDAPVLASMKRGSILVNIARGSLVDQPALVRAMETGHIAAVGLDVLAEEPASPDDPLLAQPNAILTPHIAGYTTLTLQGIARSLVEAVESFRRGERLPALLNAPPRPRHPLS